MHGAFSATAGRLEGGRGAESLYDDPGANEPDILNDEPEQEHFLTDIGRLVGVH